MYEKIIREINPKPKFTLDWYTGNDAYSEGDIEDVTLDIIRKCPPEQYIEEVAKNFKWPTYYHLTPLRQNIINWYPFDPNADILEIGCGMGSITNVLCERCKSVTSVELSKRRAVATLIRCREQSNLEIIVGNLNDIQFKKKYDYITLIGVLEYQGSYTNSQNPYRDFLKKIKMLLRPGGKLLIAIENKNGLKYWCGAREDHTGIPFDGICNYAYSTNRGVRTFSRAELKKLLVDSGYKNAYFYYPMPDYKLPTVIYSEKYLPRNENMENYQPYYIPSNATLIANENQIFKDVIENNAFEFMANSFFVECSDSAEIGKVIFGCISSERNDVYKVITSVTSDQKVHKKALNNMGHEHIRSAHENYKKLKQKGIHVLEETFVDNTIETSFCNLQSLDEVLANAYRENDKDLVFFLLDKLYQEILKSSVETEDYCNVLFAMRFDTFPSSNDYGPVLSEGYLDLICKNAFVDEKRDFLWIDQEWELENVPARFIIFRAIVELYFSYPWMNQVIEPSELFEHFCITDDIQKKYSQLNEFFFESVVNPLATRENAAFRGINMQHIVNNLSYLNSRQG